MNTETKTLESGTVLSELESNANLKSVVEAVNAVIRTLNAKRDRGPNSTREMTESDAQRVILGDLKDMKHGKAAEVLGLSYGQIYSARKGFTFKPVYQAGMKSGK